MTERGDATGSNGAAADRIVRVVTGIALCLLSVGVSVVSVGGGARAQDGGRLANPAPPAAAEVAAWRDAAAAALARAQARAAALNDVARTISLPSVAMLIEDADRRARAISNPARDWDFVRRQLTSARAYADKLAAGQDPYRGVTGVLVKAYRADFDGLLQPYALYVPRGEPPPGGWPLVVALHGAYSDHKLNLRRTFGKSNRAGESDEEASRNEVAFPDVPMIVVAPFGRGELMGFQGLGEDDVLQVIADVRRAYAVDGDRVYLTGLSMGGEGTWHIGLRHPDLFAAIVPVCGITDARHWVSGETSALFDATLLALTTPLAIAENASNQQVIFYHGDVDPTVPVAQSRAMAERFRQLGWLGKNVRYHELPGVNHFAWEASYRDGELFKQLAGIRRDPFPARVIFKTPSLRHNKAYWLRIDQMEHGLALAEITGERAQDAFTVQVKNVAAFSLLLDPKVVPAARPITVRAGGAVIYRGAPRPSLTFARAGAGWSAVPSPPPTASSSQPDHGSSGLFSRARARERPHIYVYGTAARPETVAAYRALAGAMADWGTGVRAHFAVKSDQEITADDLARFDLVLIGGARANAIARRAAGAGAGAALAVDDRADRLSAGGLTLTDPDRAYRLACPNPNAPGHSLLIYGADTERGLARFARFAKGNAASWGPESNLDYVIYDGAGQIRLSGVFRDRCAIGQ
jgi:poly(3-hydroxybutyrate) depolymerase